jgi:integrase
MACIRRRRGRWVVDYRDPAGVRRWVTCQTRMQAEAVLSDKFQDAQQPTRPVVAPDISVDAYADRWLGLIAATVKPRTLASYTQTLKLHLRPVFGLSKVRMLQRGTIRALLAEKLVSGLERNSVRIIHATLRALLYAAIDDGLIKSNPASRLGKQLKLVKRTQERQEQIKAFTREQLGHFLATAMEAEPKYARYWPLFFTMARTGLRLGEALGVQWADLDPGAREIRVSRALSAGEVDTPKSGHGRTVDMSQQLGRMLGQLQTIRKTEKLKRGWAEMPPWVFCSQEGTSLDAANVEKAFKRILEAAELPRHFTPHSLRHTFASLLLQQGESPAYVQRQLGHASIQLTVDTYGRWLPMGNKAAVDRLDDVTGSKMVAEAAFEGAETGSAKAVETPSRKVRKPKGARGSGPLAPSGEPWRNRTSNLLIKSQLLYQLS